ncbi:MAG TPA: potassium-transporting ATPase subunit KdpC [Syntrophorhabdaceae bacterium]|nr:potassium-transporting ATPase subunit KdpC [Syntrophorhabdaceae bacterium]
MKYLIRSVLTFIVMSVLTGLVYPFIVSGISNLTMNYQAQGSLIRSNDRIVGSRLIGQDFSGPAYFHGRPSALPKPYDASNSGGSNAGPSNSSFLKDVTARVASLRTENGLESATPLPADLVLASASGLDPHISVQSALVQKARVARERGLSGEIVEKTIERVAQKQYFWADTMVNVLELNLAMDNLSKKTDAHGGNK